MDCSNSVPRTAAVAEDAQPLLKAILGAVLAAGVAVVPLAVRSQTSDTFPVRPIRLITGPAASQNDIVARMLGAKLSESLGQPVVVENRAGAGGAIAAALVAKAAPDGYTLLSQSAQFSIRAALNANLTYDALKDFAGITRTGFSTQVLVVSSSLGARSVKELITLAKARPAPILFGSAGAGTGMHMDAERFRFVAGVEARHVGFKGASEALIEVLAGRVHYAVPGLGPALPLIKDGRLVSLALTAPQRSPLLPNVPTMAEVLPGYPDRDGSFGLMAPAGTPHPIRNRIADAVMKVLELPDVKSRMQAMGF